MPVENVNVPPKVNEIDPRQNPPEQDNANYYEKKTKEARAKREYEEEMAMTDRIRSQRDAPPESPVQIKGSVNIGEWNLTKMQEELREQTNQIKQDAQERIAALEKSNSDYREMVAQIKQEMLERTMTAQIENLQKQIAAGLSPKETDFLTQFNNIKAAAETMGLSKAGDGTVPPEIRLQMLKMEQEEAQRAREFEWKMKMDDRNWQLQLKQLESNAILENNKLQQEKERNTMFANLPAMIGQSIARGMLDAETGQPVETEHPRPPKAEKGYRIEAGVNEAGEATCPNCESTIAIGPTSRTAVCSQCGLRVPIHRIETPQETVPVTTEEEEEQ